MLGTSEFGWSLQSSNIKKCNKFEIFQIIFPVQLFRLEMEHYFIHMAAVVALTCLIRLDQISVRAYEVVSRQ